LPSSNSSEQQVNLKAAAAAAVCVMTCTTTATETNLPSFQQTRKYHQSFPIILQVQANAAKPCFNGNLAATAATLNDVGPNQASFGCLQA
jgi:hypothetical protein